MSESGGKPGWRLVPGWMKLVLILSLSLNVAIAGVVGGKAFRHWQRDVERGKWHNESGLDRRQSRVLRMVPDARRDEAREILLSRQDEYKAARETMSAAHQALADAIRQEPLDLELLASALAERRAAGGRLWGIGYEQLGEIAGRLNATDRAEMAMRLEERTKRWKERHERRGN